MTVTTKLDGYRQRKDAFYLEGEKSPLTPTQKEVFTGLSYFPENPALDLLLELDTSGPGIGEEITIATVSGVAKQYVRAGRVHFEVNGEPATLTVFKELSRGTYFVPFRDKTSGVESYEVGRYLEPRATPDGRLAFDLNLAYNPMCAYSTGWNCPIPPLENFLKVRIEAGETMPTFPKDETRLPNT